MGIEIIDSVKETIANIVSDYNTQLRHCNYIDIRLGAHHIKSATAERGVSKSANEETEFSLAVKVIGGDEILASGYYGSYIGPRDFPVIDKILITAIEHAYKRAISNASWKAITKEALGVMGNSLSDTKLAEIKIFQDTVKLQCKEDPTNIPLQKVVNESLLISKSIEDLYGQNGYNVIEISTELIRELFISSQGANIDQTYPLTEGFAYIIVRDEYNYDQLGAKGGWEVLDGDNNFKKTFKDFAFELANETIETSKAEVLQASDKEVVVVTDPHFNALLVHEIIGHPVEGDRALKMETAYAGRSWLLKNLEDNQIGKQIASKLVNVYSDTSMKGYGYYGYDSEGVKGKRVVHIEGGIFKGFLNSRETADILCEEPNGAMQTSGTQYIPVVRMTNTVFANGNRDPEEIINEVDEGYYLKGHHTPSIGESRENFSISARRVYKIEKGEIIKTYRSGGISSDSKNYLMSIDAVGNDFVLYPMPNCGKGQPMQVKRVGNGGPTMRGSARLTGAKK